MSYKVNSNVLKLTVEMDTNVSVFLRFFMDEVQKNSNPLTPKKLGRLRQSPLKTVTGSKGRMEWRKEYAAAQEVGTTRGYPIKNYTTAGTGKGYAQRGVMKAVESDAVIFRKAKVI